MQTMMEKQTTAQSTEAPQPSAPVHAHANFARKEKKYLLNEGDYLALMGLIENKLREDEYPHSHIESLYYDTPTDAMINRSMEKPLYKEKLRIRVYDNAPADGMAFVELKKKFKGIVYKRRVGLSQRGALAFMDGMDFDEALAVYPVRNAGGLSIEPTWRDRQIAREIRACVLRWAPLHPAMMISVDRTSLRTNDGSDVRMTFDFHSSWRNTNLEFGASGNTQLLEDGQVILEIKAQGGYPLWLVKALDTAHIYPVSCTKYGRAWCAAHPNTTPDINGNIPAPALD